MESSSISSGLYRPSESERPSKSEPSAVRDAAASIGERLKTLSEQLFALEKRLQPVLVPLDEDNANKLGEVHATCSEHASELRKHESDIGELTARVGALIRRLDV